jgi:hypothetical protein
MRGLVVLLAFFTGADVLAREGEADKRVDAAVEKALVLEVSQKKARLALVFTSVSSCVWGPAWPGTSGWWITRT